MAQQESAQERTERASPRRIQEARTKGQVPRSRELTTAMMLMASATGMLVLGGQMIQGLENVFRHGLHIERAKIFQSSTLIESLAGITFESMMVVVPFLLLTAVFALMSPLGVGGWVFSSEAFMFNWSRLNPITGLGRVFAWRGLVEMVKALAKFSLIAVCVGWLMWRLAPRFLGLATEPLDQALAHSAQLLGWSFLGMSVATVLIAAVDVPFQIWDYRKNLRMSRQEVREEMKETDGRPEVKGRIRRIQQEIAQRRMMAEVPKADVIITNPTHYAVALRYDQSKMRAPIVVAKGADLVCAQIRRLGAELKVPMLSMPPLARALFYSTKLNHEVPTGLYLAVAKVLAYVYQLRQGFQQGTYTPPPPKPEDLPIPPELRRD